MLVYCEFERVREFVLALLVVVLEVERDVIVLNAQQDELAPLDHLVVDDEVEVSLK
jgi:hypothetical protein